MKNFTMLVLFALSATCLSSAYEYKIGNCLDEIIAVEIMGMPLPGGGWSSSTGCGTVKTSPIAPHSISSEVEVEGVSALMVCCADYLYVYTGYNSRTKQFSSKSKVSIDASLYQTCSPIGPKTIYVTKLAHGSFQASMSNTCSSLL